jgi:hypothetical protein
MESAAEWSLLTRGVVFGLIFGVIGGLAVWAQRWLKGEPLIQRTEFSSPSILYVGFALFGGAALLALLAGMPLFAAAFFGIAILYGILVIAYKRGWRG